MILATSHSPYMADHFSPVLPQMVLADFIDAQIADAKAKDVLFSLHLKATMMKVSDPILFGHAVKAYFGSVFDGHAATLAKLGVNPNDGMGNLESRIASLPDSERAAIEADIKKAMADGPALAMVDSLTLRGVPSSRFKPGFDQIVTRQRTRRALV